MAFSSIANKNNKSKLLKKSILIQYMIVIVIFGLLLMSPFALNPGVSISVVDALFIATSSFTYTGLTTLNTPETFSTIGRIFIVIFLQIGAVGLMSVKAFIYTLIHKKISTTDRISLATEQRQYDHTNILKIIKKSILILFCVQMFFTIIIAIHFVLFYQFDILSAIWYAYFHVTAALTNGGFDLFGNSLENFRFDYTFQVYMMIIIVIGGLGFPILVDLYEAVKAKYHKRPYLISLFTKISLITTLVLTILGFIILSLTELRTIYSTYSLTESIFFVLFQTVSSRSAGLTTMNINNFSPSGQLILTLLMFIGAAPASTGGGLRTTTFAIIFLYFRSYARSKTDIVAFNRTIPKETVFNSFMTVCVAFIFIVTAVFFVSFMNPQFSTNEILFEITSAFGTTGMSLGVSAHLDDLGKLAIAFIMIVGQVGITTMLLILFDDKGEENLIRYPEENVPIG